jgi:LmbE family N-acetylglucosaminyl deacetylase
LLVLSRTHHLLVVAPHPDDETIGLGGTIHDRRRLGGSCEIVAVTDGEAADDQADDSWRHALAEQRSAEREAALETLGAAGTPVQRLGFPDRTLGDHVAGLEEALTEAFVTARKYHFACVAALPCRLDGHPDHRATNRAGLRAAARAGIPTVEVPIWSWYETLSRRRLRSLRLQRLAISPQARRRKQLALECFQSQTRPLPGGRGPVLPSDFMAAFDRPFELLVR